VIPLPADTRHGAARWAAFSNRHSTAWSNWRIAYGTLRLLVGEEELPRLNVWGWGGGTAFAEVQLATMLGHEGVVLTSRPERHAYARRGGVASLDRGPFANLAFDSARYAADAEYRSVYVAAENAFLDAVRERTAGEGVHVFVEPIGTPVFRATLKALAREGVLTTFGWSEGMAMWYLRAQECIRRHQLVHTHFASRQEVLDAMAFAEEHSWLPEIDERIWSFDEVPELAASYAAERLGMFPVCRINPE
jgi:NADPH:quinone reductase-like Zn-dependent oxidoreductase